MVDQHPNNAAQERRTSTLSAKAIEEYKEIYREEFGGELSDAEAEEQAKRLLRLFALLVRPLPGEAEKQQ